MAVLKKSDFRNMLEDVFDETKVRNLVEFLSKTELFHDI
jgi:hypothetical protein